MTKVLIIDGQQQEVDENLTLLQACEQAGAEIPRFCYHERLSIAGNCRMCLVEVEGAPKPIASCAQTVRELRPNPDGSPNVIHTKTPLVKKAREGVMEFLLINHPLDCPICDQGGECDLQDQAMAFGVGGSRYDENKRAVEEKYIGPLIKTVMTRCIHCTRCVRFMTEVAGVEELGLAGRGEDAEITTYLEQGTMSELSANAVDLCPVGALTHRPWAHNARPWELDKTESIDVMDAVGSAIRVDTRGREVMRILPRNNDAVNEEWISDKTRHVSDGLKTQRLDQPYLRREGQLQPASWDEALQIVADRLKAAKPETVGAIAGDLAGAEEMFALKGLLASLGVKNLDCRQAGEVLDPEWGRASYIFNTTIEGIDNADAILLVGTNPRAEAAVLNGRIRQRWRQGGLSVGVIGERVPMTYATTYLGAGPDTLKNLHDGEGAFADVLKAAKRPMIVVGAGGTARADGAAILGLAAKLAMSLKANADADWRIFNVLHSAAARAGGLDIGFVPRDGGLSSANIVSAAGSGKIETLYLLGADEIDMSALGKAFVIYQGSHGDAGAHRADVILPGAAYTEKGATYVNTEGRVQLTARAIFPPGDAKEDWKILRALSGLCGQVLPFDTLSDLRREMYKSSQALKKIDAVDVADYDKSLKMLAGLGGAVVDTPFAPSVGDFYLTNPIARASAIMGELSALSASKAVNPALTAAE